MTSLPKLIVSDIDGTLLHGSQSEINPRLFQLIEALSRRGVGFAPASGRQYHSLRRLFAPVAHQLCFLCENGAAVYGPSASEEAAVPLSNTFMDDGLCRQLCREIMAEPNLDVLISCNNMSYILPRHPQLVERIANFTGNHFRCVSSLEEVPHEIIKMAAFCVDGSAAYDRTLGDRWRKYFTVSIAGELWLDFTLANKGTGIAALAGALGIPLSQVMAFGDNFNDQPMLDVVGYPVIMENAAPALLQRYPNRCYRVEAYLEALLAQSPAGDGQQGG